MASLIALEQYGLPALHVSSERIRARDAVVICRNRGCGLWIMATGPAKVADVEVKVHGLSNSRFLFPGQMAATA